MPVRVGSSEGLGRTLKVEAKDQWRKEGSHEEHGSDLKTEEPTEQVGRASKQRKPSRVGLGLELRLYRFAAVGTGLRFRLALGLPLRR
jgi:hypothetical protein